MRLGPKRVAPACLACSLWTVIKVYAGLLKAEHGARPDQRSKLTQSFHASIALRSLSAACLLFVDEEWAALKAAVLFQTQVKATQTHWAAHLKSLLHHLYTAISLRGSLKYSSGLEEQHKATEDQMTNAHIQRSAQDTAACGKRPMRRFSGFNTD